MRHRGNPGAGLQITGSFPNAPPPAGVDTAIEVLINNSFSYDPTTQGAITSLSASADKNLSVNVNVNGTGFGNTFRPTILQGGVFYVAAVSGCWGWSPPGGALSYADLILAGLLLAPAAWAGGMYDGTYHGQLTADGNNAMSCAKQAPIQMTVANDQLEYHHFGNAVIHATVASDGRFSGSAQNAFTGGRNTPQILTVTGQIAGGGISAKATVSTACSYVLS